MRNYIVLNGDHLEEESHHHPAYRRDSGRLSDWQYSQTAYSAYYPESICAISSLWLQCAGAARYNQLGRSMRGCQ